MSTARTPGQSRRELACASCIRAEGVVLAGGEELRAPVVVTACHPQITFLRQLDRADLPPEFVQDIEHWSSRSGVVKINLAISRLPKLAARPEWTDYSGGFEIAPSLAMLEKGFAEGFIQPHFRGMWTVARDPAEAIAQIETAPRWRRGGGDARGGGTG